MSSTRRHMNVLPTFFTDNKILPEDIFEIRQDGNTWKAMYVREIIDAE